MDASGEQLKSATAYRDTERVMCAYERGSEEEEGESVCVEEEEEKKRKQRL